MDHGGSGRRHGVNLVLTGAGTARPQYGAGGKHGKTGGAVSRIGFS